MRRARERVVGAAVGVALLSAGAACTLLTSLDGLTGGGGTSADASALEDAQGSGDATGNVTPDGSDLRDAPLGAGDAGDAGSLSDSSTPPFCASQSPAPTFCDDFDDPSDAAALTAPWDQITGMGGTVVRAGGIFTSSPLAMLATAAPVVAGGNLDLSAYKAFPSAATTGQYTLAFDLYVESPDTSAKSDAVLAAIQLFDTLGDRWDQQLEVSYDAADGGVLDVDFSEDRAPASDAGACCTSHPVQQTLPVGAWTRVTMSVTVSLDIATVALHFGATEVFKLANVPVTVLNGEPEILVGLTYAAPSTQGWTVRYDDVTFVAP